MSWLQYSSIHGKCEALSQVEAKIMIYGPFTTILIFQESGPVRDIIFRLMSLMMRSVPSNALQQVMPSSILLINKDFIKFSFLEN